MTTATPSQPKKHHLGKDLFELLGSMRFAVSLLVFIAITTIIGTVLQQDQTELQYIDTFGTFWYAVFSKFDVDKIYNAWWFLLIMAFLVISTTVCLIRNVPKMIKDMRTFRDYVRQTSLRAFAHRLDIQTDISQEDGLALGRTWLKHHGYAFVEKKDGPTTLLAAKKGSTNRLGFICAHAAIVVICLGGLLDSELLNRLQMWTGFKEPIPDTARYTSQVGPQSHFSTSNPSFRGNLMVAEGDSTDYAMITMDNKLFMQDLPFKVKLNKFVIDYYEQNGMPKRFASDVDITDTQTGQTYQHQIIEVNHPYTLHGVTLYQSSFTDGGSKLWLTAFPMHGDSANSFKFEATVGQNHGLEMSLGPDQPKYQVTFDEFSPINVEDMSDPTGQAPTQKSLEDQLQQAMGSAAGKQTNLHNVGPTITYTLKDSRNQSIQYKNYMLPVMIKGDNVFLIGLRTPNDDQFKYVFIPADSQGTMNEFLQLRAAFNDPVMRAKAAQRYVQMLEHSSSIDPNTMTRLAEQALQIFAQAGFKGIDDFVEGTHVDPSKRMPVDMRKKVKGLMRDYVVFSTLQMRDLVREEKGLPPIAMNTPEQEQENAKWLDLAIRALSDLPYYPAPVTFQLDKFEHIQATVLQATRSPGKFFVYLGCIFLMVGVFVMFYIRDRRLWFWVTSTQTGCTIKAAMTSHKRNLDFVKEYEQFYQDFEGLAQNKDAS